MPPCSPYIDPGNLGHVLVVTTGNYPTGGDLYPGRVVYNLTTQRLERYDGTGWIIMGEPVQSYTPTLAGWSIGNGTRVGTYHRSDGWCDFTAVITAGSTTTFAGATVGLPIAYATGVEFETCIVGMLDSSAGLRYPGITLPASTTTLTIAAIQVNGTYAGPEVGLSTIIPFTWATGDWITVSGRYRMSTPYL